jgi:GNAT superfamily N-acetyltransferase
MLKVSELWYQMHQSLEWPESMRKENQDEKNLYLNLVARQEHPDWGIYVSEENNEIIGFLMAYIHYPDYSKYHKLVTCEAIYVKKEFRGNGIYKELIKEAKDWALKREVDEIEIVSMNTEKYNNFYESLHFLPVKTIWRIKLEA